MRFTVDLIGSGTATARFITGLEDYRLFNIRYDFAPIPEPATVLLVGVGLAVAMRFVRRPSSVDGRVGRDQRRT